MSTYKDAVRIDAGDSVQQVARAAKILAIPGGVVLLEGFVALRSTGTHLRCEVIDPMPGARRCANEYEVLVENAQRMLQASQLRDLLPNVPRRWVVVEDHGTQTAELWHA